MNELDGNEENHFFIKVVGIGDVGIRVMESMINEPICGIEYIAVDSDVGTLNTSTAPAKIELGKCITQWHSSTRTSQTAGSAEVKLLEDIGDTLKDTDMLILVAGMGGRTGTAVIQVIAEYAKSLGIDSIVSLVSLPYSHKDNIHIKRAINGICSLSKQVSSLIIFKNGDTNNFIAATRGITELIIPDFLMASSYSDVMCVLQGEYPVTFGLGESSGSNRALEAFQNALQVISLGGVEIEQASGVLVNITGSPDMTMDDYNVITRIIQEKTTEEANIKIGVVRDDHLGDKIRVAVYLTKKHTDNTTDLDTDSGSTLIEKQMQKLENRIFSPMVSYIKEEDDDDDDEYEFTHGDSMYEIYAHPRTCNVCSFDFTEVYGKYGNSIPEWQPIVCPNCHSRLARTWG